MRIIRPWGIFVLLLAGLLTVACDDQVQQSGDQLQAQKQAALDKEAAMSIGVPAIKNHREMRLYKQVFEDRDQMDLRTWTYVFSEQTGKYIFFCDSIGYGIPYATQYTSPQKAVWVDDHGYFLMPQADPNGLFSPASADGTWVECKDPEGKRTKPTYIEPRVIVSPFKLP